MIKLNKDTQKAQSFIWEHKKSTNFILDDCYIKYSFAKKRAFDYCINKKNEMGGNNGRIISYNCSFFSYAFMTDDNKLIVICPTNEYEIQL